MRTNAAHRHRRPTAWVATLALAMVLPALRIPPAAAAPRPYGRAVHDFRGPTPLWVRGFIADDCLTSEAACRTQTDPSKPRREATAQVKAMRQLAGLLGSTLSPNGLYNNDPSRPGSADAVQWEARARDWRAKSATPPGAPYTTSWTGRVDIMVDHGAGNDPTIYEVKDWWYYAANTPNKVDEQILGYKGALDGTAPGGLNPALVVDRGVQLEGWVRAYVDPDGEVSCVWGDPDIFLHAGNVYFAKSYHPNLPDGTKPGQPDVKDQCRDESRQRQQSTVADGAAAAAAAQLALVRDAARAATIAAGRPALSPADQETDMDCVGQFQVDVPMDPLRATTLRFDYGDGVTEDLAVAQGTGVAHLLVTHRFRAGAWSYAQSATIVETGASANATTHHDAEHVQRLPIGPNHVGTFTVAGNGGGSVTTVGHQNYGDPTLAATQTVSATMAFADVRGSFSVRTAPHPEFGWKLAPGTYDVNWTQVGYQDHFNWAYPAGNCRSGAPGATKVGTVTIDGSGQITGGAGSGLASYASNEARFWLPVTAVANVDEEESGVCVSGAAGQNANQAPLQVGPPTYRRSVAMDNHVGLMKVYGNRLDTETVTVTGHDEFGAPSEAGVQTVSPEMARADAGATSSARWFKVWTGPDPATGWKLATGTYDVNWVNTGYSDHTTLSDSCEIWTVPSTAINLGTVHITDGTIDSAAGTYKIGYASNWAQFEMPLSVANSGTKEAGVCISDQVGAHNGNQAPLKLM